MKAGINRFISIAALSVCFTILYGCSVTNPVLDENKKIHVYECKTEKIIYNLSDSTKVFLYITPNQDNTIINLFENGILTFKILKDACQYQGKWYEFDAIQPVIIRTSSNTCSEEANNEIANEKAVYISFYYSSPKIDADGSTLNRFEIIFGRQSALQLFNLKQISQDHYAIRYRGMII